jgi:hypothetical protein
MREAKIELQPQPNKPKATLWQLLRSLMGLILNSYMESARQLQELWLSRI